MAGAECPTEPPDPSRSTTPRLFAPRLALLPPGSLPPLACRPPQGCCTVEPTRPAASGGKQMGGGGGPANAGGLNGEQLNEAAGLVGTHAYSILDARELGLLPGVSFSSGLLGQTRLIKCDPTTARITRPARRGPARPAYRSPFTPPPAAPPVRPVVVGTAGCATRGEGTSGRAHGRTAARSGTRTRSSSSGCARRSASLERLNPTGPKRAPTSPRRDVPHSSLPTHVVDRPLAMPACGQDADDGCFWMPWDKFYEAGFQQIDICDRTTKDDLRLDVNEDRGPCGLALGATCGCARFFCLCGGVRQLYFGKRSSKRTKSTKRGCEKCTEPSDVVEPTEVQVVRG